MEISVASQLWAIVYSLAVGVFLGLSYDVVRITRVLAGLRPCAPTRLSSVNLPIIGRRAGEIKKRNRFFADVFVFCGDIIYFTFAAFVFLVFVFHANYGNGRWFIVGGCIVGFVLYIFDCRTCCNACVQHGELCIVGGICVSYVFPAVSVQNDLFTDRSADGSNGKSPKKLNADGSRSKRTCTGA